MARPFDKMWLLVTVKSLTHHRNPKHYQLVIQNHSIDNEFTIENQFAHNYEYVYKLWKCKPVERQLIKIQMFEKVIEGGKDILAKRGEASPLVNYTSDGEKFQFYASNQHRSVLILKFKAVTQQQIEQQTNREKLYNLNRNMSQILEGNRLQGKEQAKYLDNTNQLIYNWNKNVQNSAISISPPRKSKELPIGQEQTRPQVVKQISTYRDSRKNFVLSNAKYLNGDIEVSLNHTPTAQAYNRRLIRPKTEAENLHQGLQLSIKKRRELYLCKKVDSIVQKYSDSPILSAYKSETNSINRQSQEDKQNHSTAKIDHSAQTDRIQSKKKYSPLLKHHPDDYQTPQTYKQNNRAENFEDSKDEIIPKTGTDEIVRATNFPQNHPRYEPTNKQFGTIRRKKSASQNKNRDSIQDTRIRPLEEGNITHISRNSRISNPSKDKYINLNLYNFKASLYQSKGRCLRKLMLVFQDSRYATENVECITLKASWKQRFGIRNCIQSSYLYCRLYCDQQQEGQATISMRELSQSSHNSCRAFFYFKQLAVGYLQFDFTKSECIPIPSSQDFGQLHGNRLPKIRNDSLPKGLNRNDISLPLSRKESIEKKINPSKSKKKILILKQRDPLLRNDERSVGKATKNEGSGITKIRQKKLKLKCKNK